MGIKVTTAFLIFRLLVCFIYKRKEIIAILNSSAFKKITFMRNSIGTCFCIGFGTEILAVSVISLTISGALLFNGFNPPIFKPPDILPPLSCL
jgi:hypothetical protein